jgi:hypothetical protein
LNEREKEHPNPEESGSIRNTKVANPLCGTRACPEFVLLFAASVAGGKNSLQKVGSFWIFFSILVSQALPLLPT